MSTTISIKNDDYEVVALSREELRWGIIDLDNLLILKKIDRNPMPTLRAGDVVFTNGVVIIPYMVRAWSQKDIWTCVRLASYPKELYNSSIPGNDRRMGTETNIDQKNIELIYRDGKEIWKRLT